MLEHLLDLDPEVFLLDEATPVEKAPPAHVIAAQAATAQWLEDLGEAAEGTGNDAFMAREAFVCISKGSPDEQQRARLLTLNSPPAVQHLVAMLTAYDWEFVNQARELRGYVVAGLVKESTDANAKVRLRALELLGKVTEVASFTERSEVHHVHTTDQEIDEKIKAKLSRFLPAIGVTDVTDVTP